MCLQISQSDLLLELAAELDMHDLPLGAVAAGFGVVVGMLRVESGFWE